MKTCAFCSSVIVGTAISCVACGAKFDTIACLQNHADLKHPNANLQWSQDRKRPMLSIALLCLGAAAMLLLFWLTPEMFQK